MLQCTPIEGEIAPIPTASSDTSKYVSIERAPGRVCNTNRCILVHKIFMKFGNILHYSIRWKSHRLWPAQVDSCAIHRATSGNVNFAKQRTTRVIILRWVQNADG